MQEQNRAFWTTQDSNLPYGLLHHGEHICDIIAYRKKAPDEQRRWWTMGKIVVQRPELHRVYLGVSQMLAPFLNQVSGASGTFDMQLRDYGLTLRDWESYFTDWFLTDRSGWKQSIHPPLFYEPEIVEWPTPVREW